MRESLIVDQEKSGTRKNGVDDHALDVRCVIYNSHPDIYPFHYLLRGIRSPLQHRRTPGEPPQLLSFSCGLLVLPAVPVDIPVRSRHVWFWNTIISRETDHYRSPKEPSRWLDQAIKYWATRISVEGPRTPKALQGCLLACPI